MTAWSFQWELKGLKEAEVIFLGRLIEGEGSGIKGIKNSIKKLSMGDLGNEDIIHQYKKIIIIKNMSANIQLGDVFNRKLI